jgi:hypothetical protein
VEPTEQAISVPLRGRRSHPQDLEAGTIQSFLLFVSFFCINLFVMLDSLLQRKSTGVKPHYLDIWFPAHDDDEATAKKLVTNNMKCYA